MMSYDLFRYSMMGLTFSSTGSSDQLADKSSFASEKSSQSIVVGRAPAANH